MTDTTFPPQMTGMASADSMSSIARVQTAKASNYLVQLCKHFGHKLKFDYDRHHARIVYNDRVCELDVQNDDTLVMTMTAPDRDQLAAIEDMVARHLQRFAYKENLAVRWVRQV